MTSIIVELAEKVSIGNIERQGDDCGADGMVHFSKKSVIEW